MMKTKLRRVGWAATVSVMMVMGAHAQEGEFAIGEEVEVAEEEEFLTSEIEIGAGYVDEDSFKFGQYNGLEDDGLFFIGNANVYRRGAYDGDDTQYFRARANNLGLDNRDVYVEFGRQGRFKLFALYDSIPHNRINDGVTVYDGVGSNDLQAPAGWPAGLTDVSAFPVATFAKGLDIEHERNRYGVGMALTSNRRWSVDFKVRREEREGTKLTAGVFGSNGGNPASVLLPEPIDYTTDLVDAGVNYTTEKAQFRLAYNGSFFNNDYKALKWDNLWTGGQPGGGAWTDPVPDEGQLGLPPDNQAHYLSLSGGYNVSPKTRLHGQVRYSMLLQDENFLPTTINPDLTATALPRNSLDGELRELLVDFAADTRITNKLNLRANLRYIDSKNDTPRDTYLVVHNDVVDSGGAGTADARVNLPYQFDKLNLGIEGTYRLGKMTKLRGGYHFEQVERNLQEVEETDEHTIFARLSGSLGQSTQGWLKYSYAQREGDAYSTTRPFVEGHTAPYLGTLTPGCNEPAPTTPQCENHPELRKYIFADRNRNELTGVLNWFGADNFSVGARATYQNDDYDETVLGLTEQTTRRLSIEPAYQVADLLSAHAYVTYEILEYDQRGHEFQGFGPTQNFTDPTQRWSIDTEDTITTLGVGLTRKKIMENLDVALEYTYSDATTEMSSTSGPSGVFPGPAANLPDINTTLNRISLRLDYAHKRDLTFRFQYAYENYDTDDFALDGVVIGLSDDTLGIGNTSPDYDAHVFGVSMLYKFR
jgi:MtrB/PioB family decaheme-associated outer membrane protein